MAASNGQGHVSKVTATKIRAIPVVALLDIGDDPGCEDAATHEKGQQTCASDRDGGPQVVVVVDGSFCASGA